MKPKRINLIPTEVRVFSFHGFVKRYLLKTPVHTIVGSIILLLVFIYVYQIVASFRYKLRITIQKKNIKRLEAELAATKEKQKELKAQKETIDGENKNIRKRITFLEGAKAEAIKWSEVLLRLSKLAPADLWIGKISLAKDVIIINGTTLDNAKVSGFMVDLDASGYFKDTSFNFTQKKEKKGSPPVINFEVTTHLGR